MTAAARLGAEEERRLIRYVALRTDGGVENISVRLGPRTDGSNAVGTSSLFAMQMRIYERQLTVTPAPTRGRGLVKILAMS